MADKNQLLFRPNEEIAIPWYMNYINIDYTVRDKYSNKKKNFKEYDLNILGITDQSCYTGAINQHHDFPIYRDNNDWKNDPITPRMGDVNELYIIRNKTIEKKNYSFLLKYYKECYPLHMIFKANEATDIDIHRYFYSEPLELKYRTKDSDGKIIYGKLENYNINRYSELSGTKTYNSFGELGLKVKDPEDLYNENTQINTIKLIQTDNNDNGLSPATTYSNMFISPNSSDISGLDKYYSYLSAKYNNFIIHHEYLKPNINLNTDFNLIYGTNYKSFAIGSNKFTFIQDGVNILDNAPIGLSNNENYTYIPSIYITLSPAADNILKPYGETNQIIGGNNSSYSYYIKDDKVIFNLKEDFKLTDQNTSFTRSFYYKDDNSDENILGNDCQNIDTKFKLTVNPKLKVSYLTFKYENSAYSIIAEDSLSYELLYSPDILSNSSYTLFYADKKWIKQIENDMIVKEDKMKSSVKTEIDSENNIIYYKNYVINSDNEYDKYYYISNLYNDEVSDETKQNWKEYINIISPFGNDEYVGTYFINDKGKKSKYSYSYIMNCIEKRNQITYVNDINTYIYIPNEFEGNIVFTREKFNSNNSSNHYKSIVDKYNSYKIGEDDDIFIYTNTKINSEQRINDDKVNIIYRNISSAENLIDNLYGSIFNLYPESNNNYKTFVTPKLTDSISGNTSIPINLGDLTDFNYDDNNNIKSSIVTLMQQYVDKMIHHTYLFETISENGRERYKYLENITNSFTNILDLKLESVRDKEVNTNQYVLTYLYDLTDKLSTAYNLVQSTREIYVNDIIGNKENPNKQHWYDYEYQPYERLINPYILDFYYRNFKSSWTGTTYTNAYLTYSPSEGAFTNYCDDIKNNLILNEIKDYYSTYVAKYEEYKFQRITREDNPEQEGRYHYNIGIDGDIIDEETGKPKILLYEGGTSEFKLYVFTGGQEVAFNNQDRGYYQSLFDYIDRYDDEEEYKSTYEFLMNQYAILGCAYSFIINKINDENNIFNYPNHENNNTYRYQKLNSENKNIFDYDYKNYKPFKLDVKTSMDSIPKILLRQITEDSLIDIITDGNYDEQSNNEPFKMQLYATPAEGSPYSDVGFTVQNMIYDFYNDYNNLCLNNYLRYFKPGNLSNAKDKITIIPDQYYVDGADKAVNKFIDDFRSTSFDRKLIINYNVNQVINTLEHFDNIINIMSGNARYINLNADTNENDFYDYCEAIYGNKGYKNIIIALYNLFKQMENSQYQQVRYFTYTEVTGTSTPNVNVTITGGGTSYEHPSSYDPGETYYKLVDGNYVTTSEVNADNYSSYYIKTSSSGQANTSVDPINMTSSGNTYYYDKNLGWLYGQSPTDPPQPQNISCPNPQTILFGINKWRDILDFYKVIYTYCRENNHKNIPATITIENSWSSLLPVGTIDIGNGIRFNPNDPGYQAYISFISIYEESALNYGEGYVADHRNNLNGILGSILGNNQLDNNPDVNTLLYIYADKIYIIIQNIFDKINEYNTNVLQYNSDLTKQLDQLVENLTRTKEKDDSMNIANKIFINTIENIKCTNDLSNIISLFNIYDLIKNYDDNKLKSRISAYLQRAYAYSINLGKEEDYRNLISGMYSTEAFIDEINYMSKYLQKYVYDNRKNITLNVNNGYMITVNNICYAGESEDLSKMISIVNYSLCNGYNIYWVKSSQNNDLWDSIKNYYNSFVSNIDISNSSLANLKVDGFNIRYFLHDGEYEISQNTNIYLEDLDIKPYNGTITLSIDDFKAKDLRLYMLVYYYDSFLYQIPLNNNSFKNIEPMYAVAPTVYNTEKIKPTYANKKITIPFNFSNIEDNINTELFKFSLEVWYKHKNDTNQEYHYLSDVEVKNGKLEIEIPVENPNIIDMYVIHYRAKWTYNYTQSVTYLYSKINTFIYFFNNDDGFIYERVNIEINKPYNIEYTDEIQTYWCNLFVEQSFGNDVRYWVGGKGKKTIYFDLIKTAYHGENQVYKIDKINEYDFYNGYRNYTLSYIDTLDIEHGENYNKYVIS